MRNVEDHKAAVNFEWRTAASGLRHHGVRVCIYVCVYVYTYMFVCIYICSHTCIGIEASRCYTAAAVATARSGKGLSHHFVLLSEYVHTHIHTYR